MDADTRVGGLLKVLDSERQAHESTRSALFAVQEHVRVLEAIRGQLAEDLKQALAARVGGSGARQPASETRPPQTATAEAATSGRVAATAGPRLVATAEPNTKPPLPDTLHRAYAPLKASLDAGLDVPAFLLEPLALDELVSGRTGSYYRVICRDQPGGKRLSFASASYYPAEGDAKVAACVKSLSEAVLAGLPAAVGSQIYVQGFASDQRFVRPKPIPAADASMKAVDYLPRNTSDGQYAASPRRQSASAFTNKELMILRGAYIAELIGSLTNGALKPVALEGSSRPTGDEAATSFELVLFVKW
jgi:hypothetical protein